MPHLKVSFKNRLTENTSIGYIICLGASLISVEFYLANLTKSKFENADLRDADFSLTDLTGSDLTDKQLYEEILSLQDAILPDGVTRGRARNLIVNGDAENGSMIGWNLTNSSYICAKKYENQTNEQYGKWYFHIENSSKQIVMQQRINLITYNKIIQRGGTEFVVSMNVKPLTATISMFVRPFTTNDFGHPSGLYSREKLVILKLIFCCKLIGGEGLSKFEIDGEFLHASGTLHCHRSIKSVQVTVKVFGAKIIDNIRLSIEHGGYSVE